MTNSNNLKSSAGRAGEFHVPTSHESARPDWLLHEATSDRTVIVTSLTHLRDEIMWSDFSNCVGWSVVYKEVYFMTLGRGIEKNRIYVWDGPLVPVLLAKSAREKAQIILVIPSAAAVLRAMDEGYDRLAEYISNDDASDSPLRNVSLPGWNEQNEDFIEVKTFHRDDLSSLADIYRRSWAKLPKITEKVLSHHTPHHLLAVDVRGRHFAGHGAVLQRIQNVCECIQSWKPKHLRHG